MDRKHEKALAALLTCATIKEAAQAAGIDERTMRRYMREDDFAEEYKQMTAEILQEARNRSQQLISPAFETLAGICLDANAKNTDRISAARSILEWSIKIQLIEKQNHTDDEMTGRCGVVILPDILPMPDNAIEI